ncbi:MAG: hypothetical protein U0790_22555 [Isosphaeraceae bacterium]
MAFEIREIRLTSPDWRGKLMPRLHEVTRQEGVAVWAVDEPSLKELLEICQADARGNILSAPKLNVAVGQPARMTNEETIKYVASLKRRADGAPGQASNVAFEPQLGEVHNGIRVNVLSSQLRGEALFARLAIDENRLVKMHTTSYGEPVQTKVVVESHPGKGLLHDRLHRNIGIGRQVINATIQVPEVETRRVEGEWLIPGAGALLVSTGPKSHATALKAAFEEHLIAITARLVRLEPEADPGVRKASGIQKTR